LRYGGDEKTPLEKYKIRQKNTNKSKWDDEHLVTDLRDSTVVALKAKHVKSVIEHTPDKLSPIRNESIARFLWQTGARAEEASEVRWSDFGEEDGDPDDEDDVGYRPGEGKVRLKTAKKRGTGTETRWVPVHDNLITMLNIWREEQPVVTIPETDYVFSTERSKQMSPNQINRVMRQAFDAAGFDASYTDAAGQQRHKYSAHIMRSSFATYCANEVDEIQLHHLKYLMGHEDISQTMRYVKEDVEGALRAARHGPR
jgi:integrase